MKLLLLEDDTFICEQIQTYFELNNHTIETYHNGESLLENAILEDFDIFLFDINTPRKNGIKTLQEIRKEGINTPAIFLTALGEIEFVKQGYDAGCNDYVRKPFNLEEVELRIMKLLHQSGSKVNIDNEYSFDTSKMEIYFHDKSIELSILQQNLLYILVKNIGSVVPTNTIIDYVWNDKDVCNNTLRTQIKKLRLKLENNFIINVRNSGYKIDKP